MVAMDVWPTETGPGIVATEARWRAMAREFAPSGVIGYPAGQLSCSLSGDILTVQPGAVWIDGHYAELTSVTTLTTTPTGVALVIWDPATQTAELVWRNNLVFQQVPYGVWEMSIYRRNPGGVSGDTRPFYNVWRDYTPTIRGDTADWTMGNGGISGRYFRSNGMDGIDIIHVHVRAFLGTTTVTNAGVVRVSLPTPVAIGPLVPLGTAAAGLPGGNFMGFPMAQSEDNHYVLLGGPKSTGTSTVISLWLAADFAANGVLAFSATYEQGF